MQITEKQKLLINLLFQELLKKGKKIQLKEVLDGVTRTKDSMNGLMDMDGAIFQYARDNDVEKQFQDAVTTSGVNLKDEPLRIETKEEFNKIITEKRLWGGLQLALEDGSLSGAESYQEQKDTAETYQERFPKEAEEIMKEIEQKPIKKEEKPVKKMAGNTQNQGNDQKATSREVSDEEMFSSISLAQDSLKLDDEDEAVIEMISDAPLKEVTFNNPDGPTVRYETIVRIVSIDVKDTKLEAENEVNFLLPTPLIRKIKERNELGEINGREGQYRVSASGKGKSKRYAVKTIK